MDARVYLDRLVYDGLTGPTSAVLRNLHLAHLTRVPFENFDIHLGRAIVLDRAALFDKIVNRQRGGFCYELNGLFAWLLAEMGFDVTLLSARVADDAGGFGPEFDHLALRVSCPADTEQPALPWLVDVGFGDSFLFPLRLDKLNEDQLEETRAYRINSERDGLVLAQQTAGQSWEPQYRFSLEPRQFADFAGMCRFHQTSPESPFTQRRVCTLATENGRITLTADRLITTKRGLRQERPLAEGEYETLLAEHFGIIL